MLEEMSEPRPVLIYDGKCGFCRMWLDYWKQLTGERIEYLASQDVGPRFPQIPTEAYVQSVQLVRPDGSVAGGARAVFESLEKLSLYRWVAGPSELCYRFIARRRNFFYHLTRLMFGARIEPARFAAAQWLFLRALALIYALAFASLAGQVVGLFGSNGISPAVIYLESIAKSVAANGGGAIRFLAVPSIFWLGADDTALQGMCLMGVVLAIILLVTGFQGGRFQRLVVILLFCLYLSFSAIGQEFLSFQWDSLLLEAGFLAIFLGRNRAIPWMFRWLVFRLFFLSGAVKLLSGDSTWRNLTALDFHYHTQPLPTVLAWYAEKLPSSLQRASTLAVIVVELAIPFLIFFPRRMRMFAASCLIGLQVLILLSGNYTFFNLLAIALCIFLFDDRAVGRWMPQGARLTAIEPGVDVRRRRVSAPLIAAATILTLGLIRLAQTLLVSVPAPLAVAVRYTAPLQIVNTYGLFAVMTTTRNEIIVEGSADGLAWQAYEFRYKPGALGRAPRWAAPHQPRLDWQMWFAALGNYQSNPWFANMAVRLLEGSPTVTGLLAYNPFPGQPPRYVRAMVYEYKFSDFATRRRTGEWWTREPKGQYLPAVALRPGQDEGER